jgi:hypothetical protein
MLESYGKVLSRLPNQRSAIASTRTTLGTLLSRFGRVHRLFSRFVRRLVRTPVRLSLGQINLRRLKADEGVGLDALGFCHPLSARLLEAALALRAERVLELRADVSRAGELEEGFRVLLVRNVPRGRDVLTPGSFITKSQITENTLPGLEPGFLLRCGCLKRFMMVTVQVIRISDEIREGGACAATHNHATRRERNRFYASPNRIPHQRLYGHGFGAAGFGATSGCQEKRAYVEFRRCAASRLSQGCELLGVRRGRGGILTSTTH